MASSVWRFAEFEFHEGRRELRRGDTLVNLEGKPKEVLVYLLEHAHEVVNPEDIKRAVWKTTHVSDPTVPVALKKIRDAFGDENRDRIIRTVKGDGYAFAVEVSCVAETPADPLEELGVGQPVPERPGWLLTQLVRRDSHGCTWLSKQQFGDLRRVVQFASTTEGLARLRAEAHVLEIVQASGKNVDAFSRVLDTRFDATPYLLETEYLGTSLPRWVSEQGGLNQVSESSRVGIVASVAEALDVLHTTAGWVHGDLCPDNIFLLKQKNDWAVRLGGLGRYQAEGSDARETDLFRLTTGVRPEQAAMYRAPELEGNTATREGDLYGLGVLLYQMTACNLSEGPVPGWEVRVADSVLREDIAATANRDPELRSGGAAGLPRGLRELAARRLAAEQLEASRVAADMVRQQLAAELAKRPLRRAFMGAMVLLLALLVSGALVEITHLRRDRDKAQEERKQAQTLQKFLEQLFFDGDATVRGPISAEDLAQRGLERARLLEGQPRVHAGLLNTLGAGFETLGDYPKAEQVLQQALDETSRSFGSDSPEAAETLLQQAALKDDEHKASEALQLAQHALSLQERSLPPEDIAISRTKTKIAEFFTDQGEYERAVPLLEGAIHRETGHPDLLPELSDALNDLGIAENYRGNLQHSLDLQGQSLIIDRRLLGDRHPDVAEHLMSISNAHDLLGQYGPASEEAKESLSILQGWLPPGHHEVAAAEAHVGTELSHLPDSLPEARKYLEQALGILTQEPERSNTEAYALAAFASVAFKQGNYSEALEADRRCLHIYQHLYPKPHFSWVVPLAGMAAVYYTRQQWDDLQVVIEEAYGIATSTMLADDPRRLNAELMMARLREHQRSFSDAIFLLQDVLAKSSPQSPRTQQVRATAQIELKKLSLQ